jgi:anti-sigma regulatory factor (Ser/Thr protein kinase)
VAAPSPSYSRTWPARPEHVSEARKEVVEFARDAGAGADTLFGIELAVSEACTNAIVHGYADGPAQTFTVEADCLGAELRVIVRDRGRGMVPRPDSPGLGLGLPLISQMADRVEVRSPPDGEGVELCMTFSLEGAAEAA